MIATSSQSMRILITAGTYLAVKQLERDLAGTSAFQINTACNAAQLNEQISFAHPAVVLLDTSIAGEKTPQLVRELVHRRRVPVVLRASETERAGLLLDAMEQGALAVVCKPPRSSDDDDTRATLLPTLQAAASASVSCLLTRDDYPRLPASGSSAVLSLSAGIGGLSALSGVLSQLPEESPGVIAITGLPGFLVVAYRDRMASRCGPRVKVACSGDIVRSGQILIAPGGAHLIVQCGNGGLIAAVKDGPAMHHRKPSADLLFQSLATASGQATVAVVLSGHGADGVQGLFDLKQAGARTIVQSPEHCVCNDLPSRVRSCQGAEFSLPTNKIGEKLLELAGENHMNRAA